MRRLRRMAHSSYGLLAGNAGARLGALGAIMIATLLIAHDSGGAAAVGIYTLMHVLPALVGSITSCGLAVAAAYFLAGSDGGDPRLPLTLVALAVFGAALGTVVWLAASPLLGGLLFRGVPLGLVTVAGIAVATRLLVISAKSCSQGTEDLRGSNYVIVAEESMFIPVYIILTEAGVRGYAAVILGLILSDVVTGSLAWYRLTRRGFFTRAARPSPLLARRLAAYGTRGQVGGLVQQLNLRLDFIILSALAGPAVVGVYAIGSKFAELIKVGTLAISYVLYPEFARQGWNRAAERARRLVPKAAGLSAAAAVPLFVMAGFVITALYGHSFHGAILPARIILAGLLLDGVAGVVTGYLYGIGRPGLNSWAMGVGLVFTVLLDVLLIPSMGAVGAAIASATAYTATTLALLFFLTRSSPVPMPRGLVAVEPAAVAQKH